MSRTAALFSLSTKDITLTDGQDKITFSYTSDGRVQIELKGQQIEVDRSILEYIISVLPYTFRIDYSEWKGLVGYNPL